MVYSVVILIWLVNFGISWWNAYSVGLAWVETKHSGGWPRIVAWSGAVMSACGFSWCYLIVLVFAAHGLDYLTMDHVTTALQLGYILLMPAILSAGLNITLDSWARAYRTRRLRDVGLAAWNTYAEIHDIFHAVNNYEKAFGGVVDALGGSKGSDDDSGKGFGALILVFLLVMLALVSGALTTAAIIRRTAGNVELPPFDPQWNTATDSKGRTF